MIFIVILILSLVGVYFSGALQPSVCAALLIVGVLGVYFSGHISNHLWKKRDPEGYAQGIPPTPESYIIPTWVSLLNLISYGVVVYALGMLAKKYL